jgi:exodeoxyribonuclease VII large subunit
MEIKKDYITLTDYLDNIGKIINRNFANFEWVRCEIASIKKIGPHYYIEVIDISENGNKTKNQTAIIYKTKELKTIKKFKHSTGLDLERGMKVLFKLKAEFSSKFSFSLIVDDIDPNFTLGEMEVKINKIKEKIKETGYQFLNRNLQSPLHFNNIAVISPEKAAGLADFMSEADFLSSNGVCNFDYFPATFEGDNAKDSIVNSFKKINKKIEKEGVQYDSVVIIRGGGSKMSLHCLNEFIIAVCVCRTKVPVFVGVGHEPDKVIIDDYAHYSFDTPSKVIEYISNIVFGNYLRCVDSLNNIEYMVSNNLEKASKNVTLSIQEINNKVDKIIIEEKNKTKNIMTDINNGIFNVIDYLKNKAKNNLIEIENNTILSLNSAINNKNILSVDILNNLENKLLIKEKDFKSLLSDIKELSPETNLKRGYAIIKSGNKVVTSLDKLKKLDKITIILEDGEIELNIKEK